jgi:hypothetical protein
MAQTRRIGKHNEKGVPTKRAEAAVASLWRAPSRVMQSHRTGRDVGLRSRVFALPTPNAERLTQRAPDLLPSIRANNRLITRGEYCRYY